TGCPLTLREALAYAGVDLLLEQVALLGGQDAWCAVSHWRGRSLSIEREHRDALVRCEPEVAGAGDSTIADPRVSRVPSLGAGESTPHATSSRRSFSALAPLTSISVTSWRTGDWIDVRDGGSRQATSPPSIAK